MVFLRFPTCPRDPLRGSAWSRCKNPWFLRFLRCPHNPLRGSAWSRCKNLRFFAISASAWGRCKNSRFLRLFLFELVLGSCLVVRAPAPGTGGSRVRFLPGPRAVVARCNLRFSRKHGEGFTYESHYKVSLQGISIKKGLQLALASLHSQLALDSMHLQLALDSMHLQLALDSMHLAPCTWLLALGSLHLAPCTCNLHLTPCTCDLRLTPCTWLLATCNGSHDSLQ